MTRWFNQDLPESLQVAFEKAVNFEPCILTKQTINTRRVNEVNQIDISQCNEELEVNLLMFEILTTKVRTMTLTIKIETKNNHSNNSINGTSNIATAYHKFNNNGGNTVQNKNNLQDKPTNVQVTLTGPVNRDQLFKIQEVLCDTHHNTGRNYPQMQNQRWVSMPNHLISLSQKRLKSTRQQSMKL